MGAGAHVCFCQSPGLGLQRFGWSRTASAWDDRPYARKRTDQAHTIYQSHVHAMLLLCAKSSCSHGADGTASDSIAWHGWEPNIKRPHLFSIGERTHAVHAVTFAHDQCRQPRHSWLLSFSYARVRQPPNTHTQLVSWAVASHVHSSSRKRPHHCT